MFFIVLIVGYAFQNKQIDSPSILSYEANPKETSIALYWKDENGINYKNFDRLKKAVERNNKTLVFAMNAGMYMMNGEPLGLYIENGKTLKKLNTVENAYGNFYMQPNGVFYINDKNEAFVKTSKQLAPNEQIKYASQSGPMLLIDGKLHPKFMKGSKNLNIRNGVGILPNGNILFAISKKKINFYDLALFFKKHGCKNALYLDGAISKAYLPSKNWRQMDGDFGVIIGITE